MPPIHQKPSRVPIVKAEVAEVAIPDAASSLSPYEKDTFHIESGVGADVVAFPLPPGFKDPEWFVRAWRDSAALQPPIEAYASDIDGLGHTFVPSFDLDAEDVIGNLREAHELYRAWEELYSGKDEKDLPEIPDDAALKNELEGLRRESRKQFMRAKYFFMSAVRESSFTRMRKNTRQQGETGGNWYWEVVRKNGVPIRLKHPPFQSMRVLKEDENPIKVTSKIQVTPIHWVDLIEFRKFRRYVQKTRAFNVITYFKQFGDPRHMCAHCGRYIKAKDEKAAFIKAQKRCGRKAKLATEIMHDGAVHVPGSPYFFPRWLGAKDFVFGESAASSMNLAFFNNPIPAGMLLCAGGKFADDLKDKLKEFMTQAVVKSRGFHKILTISAVADDPSLFKEGAARVNLQWVPLIKDRPKDAQFLKWMAFCEEKVGRQFRLNILMYGGSEKLNKATAWAVLKFTEERVYQPLRSEFDDLMDRTLLPAIGVTLWKFKTNSPETRDPTSMSKIYDILQRGPALSVDELRELAADIVNREYDAYGEDWSKFPHKMLEFAHDEDATLGTDVEGDTESDSGDEDEDHTEPPDTGETDTGESDSE